MEEAFRKFWEENFDWPFMQGGFESTIRMTFLAGWNAALKKEVKG